MRPMSDRVTIYDTTLRDGCQGTGISLSLHGKLSIARKLDEFGVDYIERGLAGRARAPTADRRRRRRA